MGLRKVRWVPFLFHWVEVRAQDLASVGVRDLLTALLLIAETGGGGLHAEGYHPGDGPQFQSLQAEQAPDPARGAHDRETGEAAEDRAGEEASAEAPGP